MNKPEQEWIGSPEWLTYKTTNEVYDLDYLRFLLLTPEMLEVYRCLQSGKRHARLSEADLLALLVPKRSKAEQEKIAKTSRKKMIDILSKREEIEALRKEIDLAFS